VGCQSREEPRAQTAASRLCRSVIETRSSKAASNVIAILALLFAMAGGALAAGKFLITSTKQSPFRLEYGELRR
jgi:hypothetical protein